MRNLLIILSCFLCFSVCAQTYNPSLHVVINSAMGEAQAAPLDARSMFYDGTNFLYRPYQSVNEVYSYLNLAKYRFGNFIIVIDSGGTLQGNGTYLNGTNTFWQFKDSTSNAGLVKMSLFGSNACSACLLIANNLSDLNNVVTARSNLGLGAMALLGTTAGGDLSGTYPNPTVAKFNGQLPAFYLNYNNLTNTPTIPAQFNPIQGTGMTLTGTYPNITFSATGGGGSTNSNVGSGYEWAITGTNDIKTYFTDTLHTIDSSSNTNGLTLKLANKSANSLLGYDGSGNPSVTKAGTNIIISGDSISATGSGSTIYNVRAAPYNAAGDGKIGFDGAMTATSATFTSLSATFVSGDVGKVIFIKKVGPGGLSLLDTISAFVDANHVTLTSPANTSATSCQYVYGHDDTRAFQSAINAAYAGGGGTVAVPNGYYLIAGALVHSDNNSLDPNSQLFIPSAKPPQVSGTPPVTVSIIGESVPTFNYSALGSDSSEKYTDGVIIRSILDKNQGSGALLGEAGFSGVFGSFSTTTPYIQNLSIVIPDDLNGAVRSGVDFFAAQQMFINNCTATTDVALTETHSPAYDMTGFISTASNGGTAVYFDGICWAAGFKNGYKISEHTISLDLQASGCYYGINMLPTNHASHISTAKVQWCANSLYVNQSIGAPVSMQIDQIDIEGLKNGNWFDYQTAISDTGDLINGTVNYYFVPSGVGTTTTFIVSGASNTGLYPLGNQVAGSAGQLQFRNTAFNTFAANATYQVTTNPFPLLMVGGNSVPSGPEGFAASGTTNTNGTFGYYGRNGEPTGQTNMVLENDRTGFLAYSDVLTGGSTNSSTLFGLAEGDRTFILHGGSSGLGMAIGTINNTSVTLGTNNTAQLVISNAGLLQDKQYGSGTHTGTPAFCEAWDASGNEIEIPCSSSLTFNNGLTNTSGTVQQGGALIKNTTIGFGTNILKDSLQLGASQGVAGGILEIGSGTTNYGFFMDNNKQLYLGSLNSSGALYGSNASVLVDTMGNVWLGNTGGNLNQGVYIFGSGATAVGNAVFEYNIAENYTVLSSNTTISVSGKYRRIYVDCSSGNVTITLPAVSAAGAGTTTNGFGIIYYIKRIDSSANVCTLAAAGSDTIDGSSSIVLTSLSTKEIQSVQNGHWYVD